MKPLVLIVDDNSRNRKLARDLLQLAGFDTLEAKSAEEALALAHEHLPDLVLMDLRLPDLDGSEAARRLKARPSTRQIPVVALTALTRPQDALVELGFDGYLEKPIDAVAFPTQVRGFLRG